MFQTLKPLILASGSPRRRELLGRLSIDFDVVVPQVDESREAGESPETYVLRMARLKAAAVSADHPGSWVVAADTIVILDGDVLTKPQGRSEAVEMLMRLSGRDHQVQTAWCLCCEEEGVTMSDSCCSHVRFRSFDQRWARAYVETGEPMDKAGGYGIQERGAVLVERVDGSYSNVVGLPISELVGLLETHRIVSPS